MINGMATNLRITNRIIDISINKNFSKFCFQSKFLNFKEISGISATIKKLINTIRLIKNAGLLTNVLLMAEWANTKGILMKNKVLAGVGRPTK